MTTHSSVFLPGELHGQRKLADYSPWGCKESDTTKQLTYTHSQEKLVQPSPNSTKREIDRCFWGRGTKSHDKNKLEAITATVYLR